MPPNVKIPSKPPGSGGGSVAIRGFLAQTLVALLEVAQADPPFIEITLEPPVGDEQFDFMWIDPAGSHATQVKSTRNTFEKSDAEAWAAKLEAVRSHENCRLMLVGNIPRSLDGIDQIGTVKIEKRNLHLADLHEQAAQCLAKGHALTLHLLGNFLRDAHAWDIRRRDLIKLEEADAEEQGGHAFRVMDVYVRGLEGDADRGRRELAMLRLMRLFYRAARN